MNPDIQRLIELKTILDNPELNPSDYHQYYNEQTNIQDNLIIHSLIGIICLFFVAYALVTII